MNYTISIEKTHILLKHHKHLSLKNYTNLQLMKKVKLRMKQLYSSIKIEK